MKKWHVVATIVCVLLVPIFIGFYSLGMFRIFAPMSRDVDRKVFENTKSYMHGIQQDLGKYYGEYQAADEAGQAVIKATIKVRFPEVDANKLTNPTLRQFLVDTRGF